jgi:hypothetical protein
MMLHWIRSEDCNQHEGLHKVSIYDFLYDEEVSSGDPENEEEEREKIILYYLDLGRLLQSKYDSFCLKLHS